MSTSTPDPDVLPNAPLTAGSKQTVAGIELSTEHPAEGNRPVVSLGVGEGYVHLKPSEARALGAALLKVVDTDDEGRPLSTSPRAGQTLPVSSPLDTLKHLALSATSLIDFASDRLFASEKPDVDEVSDLLDEVVVELYRALGEHVEGVVPAGVGEQGRTPGAVGAVARTYDNGAPIRLNLADGGVTHEMFPRLRTRNSNPKDAT